MVNYFSDVYKERKKQKTFVLVFFLYLIKDIYLCLLERKPSTTTSSLVCALPNTPHPISFASSSSASHQAAHRPGDCSLDPICIDDSTPTADISTAALVHDLASINDSGALVNGSSAAVNNDTPSPTTSIGRISNSIQQVLGTTDYSFRAGHFVAGIGQDIPRNYRNFPSI